MKIYFHIPIIFNFCSLHVQFYPAW